MADLLVSVTLQNNSNHNKMTKKKNPSFFFTMIFVFSLSFCVCVCAVFVQTEWQRVKQRHDGKNQESLNSVSDEFLTFCLPSLIFNKKHALIPKQSHVLLVIITGRLLSPQVSKIWLRVQCDTLMGFVWPMSSFLKQIFSGNSLWLLDPFTLLNIFQMP